MLSWLGSSIASSLTRSTSQQADAKPSSDPSTSTPPLSSSSRFPAPSDRPPFPSPSAHSDAGRANSSLTHSRPGSSVDDEDDHSAKRRKGLTGAALSTLSGALDAAIFTSALGYSAYQLWKHPPSHEDVDLALARTKSGTGTGGGLPQPEQPPPPYSAVVS